MSPERAEEILDNTVRRATEDGEPQYPTTTAQIDAILAACAEERRTALTDAAEACRVIAKHDYQTMDVLSIARGNRCDDCADAIEKLRDG